MKPKKLKRSKFGFVLALVFFLAVVVGAQIGGIGDAINDMGILINDGRNDQLVTIIVSEHPEIINSENPELEPEPVKTLEMKFKNLSEYYNKAKEERITGEVSEKTRKEAFEIANNINTALAGYAQDARENGREEAAKYYQYSGEITVFQTEVYMKNEMTRKDFDELEKRSQTERQLMNAAYNQIDPANLSPQQKKYLRNVSLKNLMENVVKAGVIIGAVTMTIRQLSKGGGEEKILIAGLAGCSKNALTQIGSPELGLAHSILSLLKTLKLSLEDSVSNIKRLVQMSS
jgi:hypothetical protein